MAATKDLKTQMAKFMEDCGVAGNPSIPGQNHLYEKTAAALYRAPGDKVRELATILDTLIGVAAGVIEMRGEVTTSPGVARWGREIRDAAAKTGVSTALIGAVMQEESHGVNHAKNAWNAVGLMQVVTTTFDGLRKGHPAIGSNISDPATNILAGAYFLKDLLAMFGGNQGLAAAAYNAGPASVKNGAAQDRPTRDKTGKVLDSSVRYANRVLRNLGLPILARPTVAGRDEYRV